MEVQPLQLEGITLETDSCESVALDALGNVYCAGYTDGALGEAHGESDDDAFVMKLDSSGNLQWVTQLGDTTTATGGDNSGEENCYSVAVDNSGNVYCAGYTDGALGEANGGNDDDDAFVMKLNSSGNLQWVTQLGGTTTASGGDNSGKDRCYSVTVDNSGNVYCAGYTGGAMGEANGGGRDALIIKLTSDGELF